MYDYLFCFIKPEDIVIFTKIFKKLKGLKIIECDYDTKYNDYYIRIEKNTHFEDFGFKDFFENFGLEYEPS